jgi:RNA polymerase sigma-70 factor (ECF subfamily)
MNESRMESLQIDVAEYYKKYGPMVFKRCRILLGDEDKAMDAMQDVFVRLLQNQDRLKGTYPSSLLYRIATNVCLNIIRYEKKRPQTNSGDSLFEFAVYDDTEDRVAIWDLLDRALGKEKISTGDIAVMHYVDGMTLKEVAEVVGLSVSGIRKRLRNLKARINYLEAEK